MREWIFRFELLHQNRLARRLWGRLNFSHGVLIYWTVPDIITALLIGICFPALAMLKIDAMRSISIYGQESNYTTWRLARMNLAIRGIDAQGLKGQPHHSAKPQVDDFSALLRSE